MVGRNVHLVDLPPRLHEAIEQIGLPGLHETLSHRHDDLEEVVEVLGLGADVGLPRRPGLNSVRIFADDFFRTLALNVHAPGLRGHRAKDRHNVLRVD